MNHKIFLGGTCNETRWRDELTGMLNTRNFFDPVVADWTPECQRIEIDEKENKCNVHFYCITSAMIGVFSIAEVVDSVHNKHKITILQIIPDGFDTRQIKSLRAVVELVEMRGGIAYIDNDLSRAARILNNCFQPGGAECP